MTGQHLTRLGGGLVLAAATAAAIAAGAAALNGPIERVRIEGRLTPFEQHQLENVIADEIEGGWLGADLEAVMSRLMALTWLREVTLRREWPRQLAVEVETQVLAAKWGGGGYLNTMGEVVKGTDGGTTYLPRFECAHAGGRRAMAVYELLRTHLTGTNLTIAELIETPLGGWRVIFAGGLTVNLGDVHLPERMARFVVVYRRVLAARIAEVVSVDARYGNGIAVRYAGDDELGGALLARSETMGD